MENNIEKDYERIADFGIPSEEEELVELEEEE